MKKQKLILKQEVKKMWWIWIILAGAVLAVLVAGFKRVQEQERYVIELFGSYYSTLMPGLRWIFPGVIQVRAVASTWEQLIPLFEEPIKIDFVDGSATPKGAEAYVRIKSPDTPYDAGDGENKTGVYRTIYEVSNWRVATRDLLENAVRSYLSGLTVDEGLTRRRAGFDLQNHLPGSEVERIKETLARFGLELMRITIMDFELEPELVKARGQVQIAEREAEAAMHERKTRARETMGSLIQMMVEASGRTLEDIQTEIRESPDLQRKLATFGEELVTRRMSIDGNALTDIRVGGGGDLEKVLLRIIAALKAGR